MVNAPEDYIEDTTSEPTEAYDRRWFYLESKIDDCDEDGLLGCFASLDAVQMRQAFKNHSETKSPIVAWNTILYCCSPPIQRYQQYEPRNAALLMADWTEDDPDFIEYMNDPENIKKVSWFASIVQKCPAHLPLPVWCQDYLAQSSNKILEVIREETISPGQVIQKIPQILGFTRRGWNAISESRRDDRGYRLYSRFNDLVNYDHMSRSDARKLIIEEEGLEDERSLQRIIAPFFYRY